MHRPDRHPSLHGMCARAILIVVQHEAASWVAALEAADREGRFLTSAGGFLVSGHKP